MKSAVHMIVPALALIPACLLAASGGRPRRPAALPAPSAPPSASLQALGLHASGAGLDRGAVPASDGGRDRRTVHIDPSVVTSGDGTRASPYRTWAEVRFEPGVSYRQKRGTIAREEILVDVSGNPGAPVRIGAYGVGAMPVIQGSEIEKGWLPVRQTGVYRKTIEASHGATGPGLAIEDGVPLAHLAWDTDCSTTFAAARNGSYSFDPGTRTVYVRCTDGLSPDSHVMEISRRYFGIHGYRRRFVEIHGLHIRYVSLHGIRFEDSSRIDVRDCFVEKLGGAVILTEPFPIQAGNGIEFGNSCSFCTVRDSVIRDIFDSGISPQIYSDGHAASEFTFSNCAISRCGFAGLEVVVLESGTNSVLRDVTARNLTITDSGTGWSGVRWAVEGRGIKVDAAGMGSRVSGVRIEGCSVSGAVSEGVYIGGEAGRVVIKRCVVCDSGLDGVLVTGSGTTTGLSLEASLISANGFGADRRSGVVVNAPNGTGFALIHNTVVDNNLSGLLVWDTAGAFTLVNNLFHGRSYRAHLVTGRALPANARVTGNFLTEYGPGKHIVACNAGSEPVTFDAAAAFEAAHACASGNLGAPDPLLADPENGAFSLRGAASPCRGAGVAVPGVDTDLAGNLFGDPPSIGAYEHGGGRSGDAP